MNSSVIHIETINRLIKFFKIQGSVYTIILISFLFNSLDLTAQGFESIVSLIPAPTEKNTGDKPQSKVWNYAGKWWTVFPNSSGTFIWRLDEALWTSVLKISFSKTVKADCKVIDNVCHILLWRKEESPSELVSVEYVPESTSYKLWSGRITTTFISLDEGVETGTIDIDGNGRMWLASDGVSEVNVRWSDPPYSSWSAPITIATGITDDDICAVISMHAQGQIGVLWSDQNTRRFGFKTHNNNATPSTWSADEMPASQSALNVKNGMSDDHLNMAIADDGILYCAVKTGYDTQGYPKVALLKRNSLGTWDNLYKVSESGTRPIVILNSFTRRLKVVYAADEDGGDILYRESSSSSILFGPPLVLISGVYLNPTSIKDNYTSDIVILASNDTSIVGALATDPMLIVNTEQSVEPDVTIYPNPAQDIIQLQFRELPVEGVSILLLDAQGKICFRASALVENERLEINLRELKLSTGLHLIMIQSIQNCRVFKFVKYNG